MITRPTKVYLQNDSLNIDWSDGQRRNYTVEELRRSCPCAGCRGHHGGEIPEPPQITADLAIIAMVPVGNYAYRIEFSDGHSTGIYTLDLLRRLGSEGKAPAE